MVADTTKDPGDVIDSGTTAADVAGIPLLPLEEAMALQSVSGDAPWADVEQMVIDLNRAAPPAARIAETIRVLAARHDFLNTFVQIDHLGHAHFVHSDAILPAIGEPIDVSTRGWTAKALDDWLVQDRKLGFDLTRDPGWRVSLFRLGLDRCRLVLTFHHAKADLTCMAEIAKEALAGFFTDSNPPTAVAAQQGWTTTRKALWSAFDAKAAQAFFAQHLGEADAIASPIASPLREGIKSGRMLRLHGHLTTHDTVALNEALKRMPGPASQTGGGFRLIHGLQLAFGLALARHGGCSVAQFGLTFSGRRGGEGAAGSLIATLPQRLNLGQVGDCAEALAQIAGSTRLLRQFHCADFAQIAEWAGDGLDGDTLFDTALVYSPQGLGQMLQPMLDSLGGGQARLLEEGRLPVTLAVYGQDSLDLTLEYDPLRLAPAQAKPLMGHVLNLLKSIAGAKPSDPLGSLVMLEPAELDLILRLSYPDTPLDEASPPPCPITRIEIQGAACPTDTAILLPDGKSMNYARLDARVNGMARDLAQVGVGPGKIVALNLAQGPDQVIAFLATQKLGAAALSLDPATPELDRNLRAAECDVVAVVGHEGLSGLSLPLVIPRGSLVLRAPTRPEPQADRLAYVLHTSGSTGRPKGVMGCTGALSAHASAVIRAYGLRPGDRVLQFASPGFDVTLEETIPTLIAGATLVLRPDEAAESIPAFLEFLERAKITVANLPAGFWHLLVAEMADHGQKLPKSLRLVITGSEKVDGRAWAEWQRLAPGVECLNCYGPTEATISTSYYRMRADQTFAPMAEVPIGRPLGHARALVMGFDGSPAPLGAEGELWISGACVTLGYLGRADETARSFVALPAELAATLGERAYRSGDRVRWSPDNQLMFKGRRDRQVKVRGHRIDLEEIERQLLHFPGIREAFVALEGSGPMAGLVAWVTVQGVMAEGPAIENLRRMAAERFGRAALPRIVPMPGLPRKPNGKIDRAALPLPTLDTPLDDRLDDHGPVPDPNLVTAIARTMGGVLGLDSLPPLADIRDLGANSLTILRMASVLEARFGRPVRNVDLHHNTTPVKFARWLALGHSQSAVGAIALQAKGSHIPFIGIHLLGDHEQLYRPLSAALGPDYPVWGVTVGAPRALSDIDIPRIAELYRQDIEKSFPTGPIALGAVSLASYFAFELAQRLITSGRDVRLLAIFDAEGPGGRPDRKGWDKIRAHLGELRRNGPAHLSRIHLLRANRRQIDADLRVAVTESEITGAGLVQANLRAVEAYHPQPIRCPLVVYRAATSFWDSQAALDEALGWRCVAAAGIDLVDVPGDHLGMLAEGNVATMAADLVHRLKR